MVIHFESSKIQTPGSSENALGKVGRAVLSAPDDRLAGDTLASTGDRRPAGDSAPYLAPAIASLVVNGFEIDTVDPHKKAIKPFPGNDDEHVNPESALRWTAAAAAVAQLGFRYGLERGGESQPKIRLSLWEVRPPIQMCPIRKPLSPTSSQEGRERRPPDAMATRRIVFWRVDEVDDGGGARGEVWRFRTRSLAFPTAEGYGRFARGGRGGRVSK